MFYSERNLSFSLPHKMFSKFVPTLSFPQVLSVFSLPRNQQTAPLPPSSTFLCFVSPCFQLFFRYLARSTKQTWKSCFCFFTEGKQHNVHEIDMITLRNHAPRSYMTWGTFHSTQNSRKFRLVNQMERTISVWSDRNIRDQLWRWSTLTGPVISVGRTEMSRSIWPNLLSTVPLFCIRAVAWVGFVQQKCTRSPGHVEFPKFQTGIFVEWKAPMITRDLECPWRNYFIIFRKFTVRFRPIRKEIVSWMFIKDKNLSGRTQYVQCTWCKVQKDYEE